MVCTIMHGQEHVDHQKKVPFIQTHHVAGSQAFRGRLMTQQMPTKRRTKPVQVQKIVKVHPHAFAIFFNRLSISMCFGLTRLSFAIENQTDKAPVLVYSFATSAETSTTIQSHLSGQQMNFWTRGFPKTRTSRACSANVQHTSTDTDWVNTPANRTFKHSVEIIWNANDACYSTRRPFQIQLANWGMDIDWLAVPKQTDSRRYSNTVVFVCKDATCYLAAVRMCVRVCVCVRVFRCECLNVSVNMRELH